MCLILLAWQACEEHPLVVAANRDEFHARPAAPAAFWDERPAILAGRDLEARGTWMGISRSGRFAAVTNFRGAGEPRAAQSRGSLVSVFLDGTERPAKYVESLVERGSSYGGFNLLVTDGAELWWMSNRDGTPRKLDPGIYGLGNALLDGSFWPALLGARFRAGRHGAGNAALPALEPAPHPAVGDAGLEVLRALLHEAVRAIERQCMRLRRKHGLAVPAGARFIDQAREDQPADAAAAPRLQHRHAPDVPVGQQPRGPHGFPILQSQGVNRIAVHLVELDLPRHALFLDEHGKADRRRLRARFLPRQELDPDGGFHGVPKV